MFREAGCCLDSRVPQFILPTTRRALQRFRLEDGDAWSYGLDQLAGEADITLARDIMTKMSRSLSYLGAVDAQYPEKFYAIKVGSMVYRRAISKKTTGTTAVARYAEWLRCQGVVWSLFFHASLAI